MKRGRLRFAPWESRNTELLQRLRGNFGHYVFPLPKDKHFEKDEKGDYRLKDRVANKKLVSLASIMKSYDEYLKENGLYDFDDMIEEAVKVLKTKKSRLNRLKLALNQVILPQ